MEKEKKQGVKSETAVRRCAKAALLLYDLKSTNSEEQAMWKRQIQDLKIQLLKERFKNSKIKLCAFLELLVQFLLLLSLWTFFLLLLLKPR
ncbi:hypothetical protein VNO77_31544 [Canavalia gladiata]|uniref:Uncharacterized protein n=1 Tax=Canavalia gladiata TaxID=3824 RepID=A0AAN9KP15_CANGL